MSIVRKYIHEGEGANDVHVVACDIFNLFITSSTISKKLQDDSKMSTTTLPPAIYYPDILSKQTEAIELPKPSQ